MNQSSTELTGPYHEYAEKFVNYCSITTLNADHPAPSQSEADWRTFDEGKIPGSDTRYKTQYRISSISQLMADKILDFRSACKRFQEILETIIAKAEKSAVSPVENLKKNHPKVYQDLQRALYLRVSLDQLEKSKNTPSPDALMNHFRYIELKIRVKINKKMYCIGGHTFLCQSRILHIILSLL